MKKSVNKIISTEKLPDEARVPDRSLSTVSRRYRARPRMAATRDPREMKKPIIVNRTASKIDQGERMWMTLNDARTENNAVIPATKYATPAAFLTLFPAA